jgi:hypothetical protein
MYVIGMLPFAALIVPGGIEALWRWAQLLRLPRAAWVMRSAVAALACAMVLVVAPQWAQGDRTAMTVRLDGLDRAAEQWVVDHVPRDKRIIVDDEYWIYLIEHGYDERRTRSSPTGPLTTTQLSSGHSRRDGEISTTSCLHRR